MATHEQQIALVTGANKGIGLEVVRQLSHKAFHVFLGARNEIAGREAAEKLQREAEKKRYQGKITFLKIDISKPDSIQRAANEFAKLNDRLDALVNNAGILLEQDEDVLKITPEIFETTLRSNSLGPCSSHRRLSSS